MNYNYLRVKNCGVLVCLILLLTNCTTTEDKKFISLKGEWVVTLDKNDKGKNEQWFNTIQPNAQPITLPSTLDEAGIGEKVIVETKLDKDVLYQLSRKNKYIGAAWYQKEIQIPNSMSDKEIVLEMERVIWKSEVWIDGEYKGTDNSLVSAHQISLGKITPGKHLITICIDNCQQYDLFDNSRGRTLTHSYTETTQIMWNGILGNFNLKALPAYSIDDLQVYPNIEKGKVEIVAKAKGQSENDITIHIIDGLGKEVSSVQTKAEENIEVELSGDFAAWDEHHPVIYTAQVKNTTGDILAQTDFGLRKIQSVENNMLLNGKRLFLRGTLECCIFPLTGHPPLNKEGWLKVFQSAKSYGLNHIRFHSWCPPEDAFQVADSLGFYLQVEMPNWSLKYGQEPEMVKWMESEGERMIRNYGNHPSFCMMAMGNELEGDYELLTGFVKRLQKEDPRHLYTTTAFTFQKPHSEEPDEVDEYWITQWTKDGWVRGQGVFDDYAPSFDKDYRASIEFLDIPLITHEIGQYSVYPNLKEIEKYTGVLTPKNFEAIKADLEKKGRLDKADDYLKASGQLAKILYKEEVERALKTPGISGFQLLDLHDFPGQGTALVGMLDAFWDSKGIVTGDEFKTFCNDLVPLIKFEKAVYTNNEVFKAKAEVANYWKNLDAPTFNWSITQKGSVLKSGSLKSKIIKQGSYAEVGVFEFELKDIHEPQKLDITLSLQGTDYKNSWSVWVYPQVQEVDKKDVVVTSRWNVAESALNEGRKVLFTPDLKEINGIEGKFVPVFWSPVHFPNQPGSMGLLIKDQHSLFNEFPTEYHTNWQWWDLCKQSKSLEVDRIVVDPVITVVDNFFKNRDLSNLFEVNVGKGKLVFSGIDLHSNMDSRITAKALLNSIVDYMNTPEFAPKQTVTFKSLSDLFQRDPDAKEAAKIGLYE
ncbi:sugar-binding domain-containing protein [Plebeiibacterium marinum]|uniref:Glycosyl hydrolases family 2 sugar binding domain-containing protein n=1 Tax=Plebeiibacterium marinum TaxID=2992111 RepID=A0AAE3SIS9_9BACT|nr:sugar-binding domain-containing protein [Plebeiobacterium marinum]MCW3804758.1 hypothetical protein [Plebeiobacterium marinum]